MNNSETDKINKMNIEIDYIKKKVNNKDLRYTAPEITKCYGVLKKLIEEYENTHDEKVYKRIVKLF
jgi:hypothetical protein